MHLVILLILYQLVGRLLCEEFNSYLLVVHGDLRLSANIGTSHGVPHRSRPVFIFLDASNKLISSLDIDLPSLNNFLQYLGILFGQLFHLPLPNEFLPSLFLKLSSLRVIPINVLLDGLPGVFGLDLFKFLPVLVERLQALKFIEKVATLNDNNLLRLAAKHD